MLSFLKNKARSQKEWKKQTIEYASAINEYVKRGLIEGWDNVGEEPKSEGREKFVPELLDAIKKANKSGDFDNLRNDWPLAHAPLIEKLEENGQSIPCVVLLDDGRIIARIGSSYQDGYVLEIDDANTKRVNGINFFGRSPCRKYFAYTTSKGVKVTKGWLGEQSTFCLYPNGTEGISDEFEVKPFDSSPRPTQLIPFPDGRRVLFVSSDGVFVLEEEGAIRLLPTEDDIEEYFEWSLSDYPDDDLTVDLSMEHGAVSIDGKYIAVGSQDSTHLVFNDEYQLISNIGNISEYPHFALFDDQSKYLALNSCHFYNGVTIVVDTSMLNGFKTEPYDNDPRTPAVETGARVYAGAYRNDEFIIGDASGYIRAFDINGNQHWQHFIGSSVGDIDISNDGSTLVCSTYAGFISILKMDQGKNEAYEIGNSGHTEIRRWLVWKNEEAPLRW